MEKAPVETAFTIKSFPEISAGVVRWPMSVIRLSSENREQLAACCDLVLKKWRSYSDPEAFIFAKTEGTPHNTITPIARKKGQVYECDLVLRNNITTEDRPLGVFHPNPSLHHIKKENIGLIEVMGLAVLPGRLANELEGIKSAYLQGWDISEEPALKQHAPWLSFLRKKYPNLNKEEIDSVAQNEVGAVFMAVLEDAGVFKRTEAGKKAFSQFLAYLD